MAFSESIKRQVKEMADFRCCRCKHISFEVHHIIPQKDGGPDTLENAAPLCPNCHTDFGDNAMKRKEIIHMRDVWYKRVEKMYPDGIQQSTGLLEKISSKLDALVVNQDKGLSDLKEVLKESALESIEKMTAGTAQLTASGIANASISPQYIEPQSDIGISRIGDISTRVLHINYVKCPKCGTLGKKDMMASMMTVPMHYKCKTCQTEFES